MKNTYRKVFVVGCPRSGTSWMSQMLGTHPSTIGLPTETHIYTLFYDPFTYLKKLSFKKRIKQKKFLFKHYGIKPILMGFKDEDIWNGFPRIFNLYKNGKNYVGIHSCLDLNEFKDLIFQARKNDIDTLIQAENFIELILDKSFYKRGGDSTKILIEKTPMHIHYVDTILMSFGEAKILEMVRDVRDVVASWKARSKKAKWANKQTADIINQWLKCISLSEEFKTNIEFSDRIYTCRYEDLRDNTFFNLENIFNFLKLPSDMQIIEGILNKNDIAKVKRKGEGEHIRQGKVGAWKDELSEIDIKLCHKMAGDTLAKLGYLT